MDLNQVLDIDWSEYAGPAAAVVGVVLAFVALHWGGQFFRRRTAKPAAEQAAEHDPFVLGSRLEKRQHQRRRGGCATVLISDGSGTAAPYQAVVIDRSASGLRLEVDRPVRVGSLLSIRPAHAAEMIPWVQVEVRNQRPAGESWEIGCLFLRPPPSTVLWMFG